eukprot:2309476-Prymnesium_polylepis.1
MTFWTEGKGEAVSAVIGVSQPNLLYRGGRAGGSWQIMSQIVPSEVPYVGNKELELRGRH